MSPDPNVPAVPAAPASPAVAQRFAADTDLMEINVRGQRQVVPVGVAKKDYQTMEASKLAIAEANRIKGDAHIDREHAERWRKLEYDLRTDPERALAGLERLAGVTRQGATSDSETPVVPHARETSALEGRLARLEQTQNQGLVRDEVKGALDAFDLFKNDSVARRAAEKQILASLVIDPRASPMDVAREVHTELFDLRSTAATQLRDTRAENQQILRTVPSGAGMPDLSDIPQGKASDLKDGTLRQRILEGARRFGAMATGQG